MMDYDPELRNKVAKHLDERLSKFTGEGSAGGGSVVVTINGALKITGVKIDPMIFEAKDPEMLEVLLASAMTSAIDRVREQTSAEAFKILSESYDKAQAASVDGISALRRAFAEMRAKQ